MPKPICTSCINFKSVCTIGMKNTYFDCKKFKPIPIDSLRKEMNQLYVSGDNPLRLEEIKDQIFYFDYGIVKQVVLCIA